MPRRVGSRTPLETSLQQALSDLVAVSGARNGTWSTPQGGLRFHQANIDTARGGEFGRRVRDGDRAFLRDLPINRIIRSNRTVCDRSARWSSRGVQEIIRCAVSSSSGPASGRFLLEMDHHLRVTESDLLAMFLHLDLLELLGQSAVRPPADARPERNRLDGPLAHDLNHLLTLAALELDCHLRGVGKGEAAGLNGLRQALNEASSLCRNCLIRDPCVRAFRRVNVASLARSEAAKTIRIARNSRKIRIRVNCKENHYVLAEIEVVSRLIRNLLLNAIEASFHDDVVSLEVSSRKGIVELAVEDSGCGMPAKDIERLLTRGASTGDGHGLGTTSILQCVSRLRGRLDVRTELGRGSRFSVVIPMVEPADVLLIDPDQRRREALASRLEAMGWTVARAGRLEDGLVRCEASAPALLALARGAPCGGSKASFDRADNRDSRICMLSAARGAASDHALDLALELERILGNRNFRAADR